MRGINKLAGDIRGGAAVNFAVAAMLVVIPAMHPSKTARVLESAQSSWQQIWTIDGLSGRGA
jgi:hypothetical protein